MSTRAQRSSSTARPLADRNARRSPVGRCTAVAALVPSCHVLGHPSLSTPRRQAVRWTTGPGRASHCRRAGALCNLEASDWDVDSWRLLDVVADAPSPASGTGSHTHGRRRAPWRVRQDFAGRDPPGEYSGQLGGTRSRARGCVLVSSKRVGGSPTPRPPPTSSGPVGSPSPWLVVAEHGTDRRVRASGSYDASAEMIRAAGLLSSQRPGSGGITSHERARESATDCCRAIPSRETSHCESVSTCLIPSVSCLPPNLSGLISNIVQLIQIRLHLRARAHRLLISSTLFAPPRRHALDASMCLHVVIDASPCFATLQRVGPAHRSPVAPIPLTDCPFCSRMPRPRRPRLATYVLVGDRSEPR
jgi:hypothetical protein